MIKQETGKKFPLWLRWVLAGPTTLIMAIAMMATSTRLGSGDEPSFNAIAFAMISFPIFWALFFFYYLMEEKLFRAIWVTLAFIASNATVLYSAFAQ